MPVRAALFRIAPDHHVLTIVVHHISADGFSLAPLARDVMVAYSSRLGGDGPQWDPLHVQYADYTLWQHAGLGSENDPESMINQQLRFWSETLAGVPDVIQLPTDRPRPIQQTFEGDRVEFAIDADIHQRLTALARANNATMFMTVHAALAVLLARLGSTDDVVIGTPVAGRGEAALDDMVGMFVNTLVLRNRIDRRRRSPNWCNGSGKPTWPRSSTRTCRSSGSSRNSTRPGPRRTHRCSRWPSNSRTTRTRHWNCRACGSRTSTSKPRW